MGQSLASGEDAFPVVTLADTGHGNFQFERGVHTWRQDEPGYCVAPETRPSGEFAFVPIVGGERVTKTGETIASGLVDSLKHSLGAGTETGFLFSYAGTGNKRLRDLDKRHDDTTDPRSMDPTPGGFYKTSIDDVRRVKAQADAKGWTYEVSAITWLQGEKNDDLRLDDWAAPLDRASFLAAYARDLIVLKNDLNSDILPITKQPRRIPVFSYQTLDAISGQAQLLASDLDPEIYVVSPTYYMDSAINSTNPLTGAWGNFIHLTGDSQRWLGAQFAKVINRVVINKQSWQPLRASIAWTSSDRNTVFVRYHVPVLPIVIDTSFMPAAPGAGLFIPGGPNIASVFVYSSDTIALILESPLPSAGAFTLEYASERGTELALSLPGGALNVSGGTASKTYDVVIAGDIRAQLAASFQHGVFYLQNNLSGVAHTNGTNGVIRNVFLDANGNTVLQGSATELSNGIPFQTGQPLAITMILPYGNIRDSDNEQSLYKFTEGPRAGQPYPLWNWSVGFEGLVISSSP
ncbi:MAG TPA: hypothetical protein VN325_28040 [Steroidobacteraceae bacterium]|nr:hypothetical protein [Steroidobacteraceae bacterium]